MILRAGLIGSVVLGLFFLWDRSRCQYRRRRRRFGCFRLVGCGIIVVIVSAIVAAVKAVILEVINQILLALEATKQATLDGRRLLQYCSELFDRHAFQ